MQNLILMKCKFDHGNDYPVTRFCLAVDCSQKRIICDQCFKKDQHQSHLQDCVPYDELVLVVTNELEKLRKFRNNLQNTFPQRNEQLQSYYDNIEQIERKMIEKDFSNLQLIINLAIRCHNSKIQEELINILYETSKDLKQLKQILVLLDKHYGAEDEMFMIRKFIERGEDLQKILTLSSSDHFELALKYYDMVLGLSINGELSYNILAKRYNLLLNFGQISKVSQALEKLFGKNGQDLHDFVFKFVEQRINVLQYKPQFDLIIPFVSAISQHSMNDKIQNALALFRYHSFDLAVKMLRQIQKYDPAYSYGLILQMLCLIGQDKLNEALEIARQELKHDRNQEALNQAQQIGLFLRGDLVEAIRSKGLKLFSNLKNSMSLARIEMYDEGLKCLNEALNICPNNIICLYFKGMLLIQQGKQNEANDIFKTLIRNKEKIDREQLLQGSLLRLQGKLQKCLQQIDLRQQEIGTDCGNYRKNVEFEKWTFLFEQREYRKALHILNVLSQIFPKNLHIYGLQALTLFEMGDLMEAKETLNLALTIVSDYHKDSFYLKFFKGFILAKMSDFKEAEKCFKEVLESQGQFIRVLSCIAIVLMKQNSYSKALPYLQNYLEQDPDNKSIIYNKGVSLLQLEMYDEALLNFNQLQLKNYKNSNIYYAMSLLYLGQFYEALCFLENLDSNPSKNTLLKSISLIGLNQFEQALKFIDNQIQQNEQISIKYYMIKAIALYYLGQYYEANFIIDSISNSEQQLETIYLFKIGLLILQEKHQEAQLLLNQIQNQNCCETLLTKVKLLKQEYINDNANDFFVQVFQQDRNRIMIRQLVKDIETLNYIEDDLQWKRSKIHLWLFNIESYNFVSDIWSWFDFEIYE